jgi:hypothetical protein
VFGALDPEKILMILVVALIVLGPQRLPKAARQLGGYWRTLLQLRAKLEQEFREAVPDFKEAFPTEDLPRLPKNPRAAVSGFVSGLLNDQSDSQPAIGTTSNGTGAAETVEPIQAEPVQVEQRGPREYAASPFIDDVSMN